MEYELVFDYENNESFAFDINDIDGLRAKNYQLIVEVDGFG